MAANDRFPAGFIDVRGTQMLVFVSAAAGRWGTTYMGDDYWADTKEGLRQRMLTTTSGCVPFSVAERRLGGAWQVRNGEATGLHAANGNIMVRWQDTGKIEQLDHFRSTRGYMEHLGRAEAAELVALLEARDAADKALRDWRRERDIDLPAAVERAITAANTEGGQ